MLQSTESQARAQSYRVFLYTILGIKKNDKKKQESVTDSPERKIQQKQTYEMAQGF